MRLLSALLFAVTLAAAVKLPPYTRQLLPNGAVLDVMPRRDVPLVTIRILIKGGAESDPAEMPGLSSVVAEMLRRGTAKRSAEKFSQDLDELGATLSADTDDESTAISLEFLAKDFAAALNLLQDAVLQPTFPEAEIKKLIAQRIDGVKSVKDSPQSAAGLYYRAFFFGTNHPYGRLPDEAAYAGMTRAAIVEYHKKMYVGKNLILITGGDFDLNAASQKIAAVFGKLPEGRPYVWKQAASAAPHGSRLALVDKPDATQTYFYIAQPGIPRNHPDRIPLWLVNTLFGGRFTSMLMQELRVASGLTYGAYSRFDLSHLPGSLAVVSFSETDNTLKALDLALDVLRRLGDKGISAEQLESAKTYIKGVYPSDRLETADQLAETLGEIELNDLNRNEVDDLFQRIDSVTLDTANQIARKYYRDDNLTFLLLGNAQKFRTGVRKYAKDIFEVAITTPGFAVQPSGKPSPGASRQSGDAIPAPIHKENSR
ncbi:MAG TPA: pitrilysin family protein [Bryobacteraceae bacterium]|nr:pitrilysin family protein [Bryobacteraceae bacterium]